MDYEFHVYYLVDTRKRNFNGDLMAYVGRSKELAGRLQSHFRKQGIFHRRAPSTIKASILAQSNDLEYIKLKESFWIAEKKTLRPFGYNRIA